MTGRRRPQASQVQEPGYWGALRLIA